jgi:hypothetical protein
MVPKGTPPIIELRAAIIQTANSPDEKPAYRREPKSSPNVAGIPRGRARFNGEERIGREGRSDSKLE